MNFERFADDIKSNNWKVHGVEVYKDNELIHSFGDTREGLYGLVL